jgi:hypothetical protein
MSYPDKCSVVPLHLYTELAYHIETGQTTLFKSWNYDINNLSSSWFVEFFISVILFKCTLVWYSSLRINPFQSNFSATHLLPSSYLFWAGRRLVDYLSVQHEEKCRTGSDSGAGEQTQQKKCRTSSNIGAEQENHNVGQGPTDRKGLRLSVPSKTLHIFTSQQGWILFVS